MKSAATFSSFHSNIQFPCDGSASKKETIGSICFDDLKRYESIGLRAAGLFGQIKRNGRFHRVASGGNRLMRRNRKN